MNSTMEHYENIIACDYCNKIWMDATPSVGDNKPKFVPLAENEEFMI